MNLTTLSQKLTLVECIGKRAWRSFALVYLMGYILGLYAMFFYPIKPAIAQAISINAALFFMAAQMFLYYLLPLFIDCIDVTVRARQPHFYEPDLSQYPPQQRPRWVRMRDR